MWLRELILAVAITLSWAVDHTIYRYCSEIDVCRYYFDIYLKFTLNLKNYSENRELAREERWKVLIEGASFSRGVASFRVQSTEDTDKFLSLNITAVKGGIFRVQIEEPDSTRYHIEHVLDGEPEIVKLV